MTKLKKLIEQLIQEELNTFLDEDAERRRAFAQDMRDQGISPEKTSVEKQKQARGWVDKANAKTRDMMRMGRPIKQLFAKHADHAWLSTLPTVHFATIPDLFKLLHNVSSKDELSANAFLPGQMGDAPPWANAGLVIKGHITLLANDMDKVHSGEGQRYTKAEPGRTKMSGANKGVRQVYKPGAYEHRKLLVFDKKDWKPSMYKQESNNEALVDNWKPVAVILGAYGESSFRAIEQLLKEKGIDIPIMSADDAKEAF